MNPRPVEPSWYAHLNCVILQPSYLPWRGYFHQIQKADVFVFYDDVQVDKHGWRNRNLVKGPNGLQWLSVPILSKGATHGPALNDVRTDPSDPRWARKHRQTLKQLYGKMPHFKRYADVRAPFYEDPPELLVELTINTTVALARAMGLAPRFVRSSELNIKGGKVERLVAITQHVEATHYITGPAATSYLDEDPFRSRRHRRRVHGIRLPGVRAAIPPVRVSGFHRRPAVRGGSGGTALHLGPTERTSRIMREARGILIAKEDS